MVMELNSVRGIRLQVKKVLDDRLLCRCVEKGETYRVPFDAISRVSFVKQDVQDYGGSFLCGIPVGDGLVSVRQYGQLLGEPLELEEAAQGLHRLFLEQTPVRGRILEWHRDSLFVSCWGLRVRYRDPDLKEDFRKVFWEQEEISGLIYKTDVVRKRFFMSPKGRSDAGKSRKVEVSESLLEDLRSSFSSSAFGSSSKG